MLDSGFNTLADSYKSEQNHECDKLRMVAVVQESGEHMKETAKTILAFILISICYLGFTYLVLFQALQSDLYLMWLVLMALFASFIPVAIIKRKYLAGLIHFLAVVAVYWGIFEYEKMHSDWAWALLMILPGVLIYAAFATLVTILMAALGQSISGGNQ